MTTPQKHGARILRPISRNTLAEQIVTILKRFILVEGLKEGDMLPSERRLTESFGVSQRVLREALSILAGQGIIAKAHGRGIFVKAFDSDRLRFDPVSPTRSVLDLYRMRCAIEVGAASIAAEQADEEDIAELQEIIRDMTPKAERRESLIAEELRFHLALLRATHNEVLQQMEPLLAESIRIRIYETPEKLHQSSGVHPTIEEHQAIVDAFRDRDSARAVSVMLTHQKRLWSNLSASGPDDEESHVDVTRGRGQPAPADGTAR